MNRLISNYIVFAERFIPARFRANPLEYWRSHNIVHAALFAATAGPMYMGIYFAIGHVVPVFMVLACVSLTACSPLVLKYSKSLEVAQSTLIGGLFICFSLLTYYFGGLKSPITLWLLCCPVAAMFLGGRKAAISWFMIVTSMMLAFYALDMRGWQYPVASSENGSLLWLLSDVGLMAMIVFYVYLYEITKNRGFVNLQQALEQIGELAKRDELTGAYNRRHVLALIDEQRELTKRASDTFCIALLDLDYFKRINDTYGHVIGDSVLRTFSTIVNHQLRGTDTFGRYGGEEFLVLMPATRLVDAMLVAERIRNAVESASLNHVAPNLHMTVSIGVTQYHADQGLTDLINCADTALYTAKKHGRNQVCASNEAVEGAHAA